MQAITWLRENWLTLAIVLALVVGYFALTERPSEIGSIPDFLASLSGGQPTILHFYSNY
ncbi:MAG: hypothetical protein ACYC6L_11015 [Anaerolineae bacterium]